MGVDTILLIIALICFLLEAFRGSVNLNFGINLGWLGLAFWVLSVLI